MSHGHKCGSGSFDHAGPACCRAGLLARRANAERQTTSSSGRRRVRRAHRFGACTSFSLTTSAPPRQAPGPGGAAAVRKQIGTASEAARCASNARQACGRGAPSGNLTAPSRLLDTIRRCANLERHHVQPALPHLRQRVAPVSGQSAGRNPTSASCSRISAITSAIIVGTGDVHHAGLQKPLVVAGKASRQIPWPAAATQRGAHTRADIRNLSMPIAHTTATRTRSRLTRGAAGIGNGKSGSHGVTSQESRNVAGQPSRQIRRGHHNALRIQKHGA